MSNFAFQDRPIADRFAEGIMKAGMPGAREYLPAFQEYRLKGEEIKKLLFGSKIIGPYPTGGHWWIDRKNNGEIAYGGPEPVTSDIGKTRVENDLLCNQFQKYMGGVEYCATVFKNPNGTRERMDEYFAITDIGFTTFSPMK